MHDKGPWSDDALEAQFAALRDTPADLPDALMHRVLADAVMVQNRAKGRAAAWVSLRSIFAAIGGWGGASGLVAAGLAGIWIGFSGAGGLIPGTVTDADLSALEVMPGADIFSALGLEQGG